MGKPEKRKPKTVPLDVLDTKWNECFSKVYELNPLENNEPPTAEESASFIEELRTLKDELNTTKSLLNNLDIVKWGKHTKAMHLCGQITWFLAKNVNAELVTQAWAKFYTILSNFDVLKDADLNNVNTLHLCEAPGSFVSSLNHFIRCNYGEDVVWNWMATTLNPYHEENNTCQMIEDDRFVIETLPHWEFGPDFTGNIMNPDNLTHLEKRLGGAYINLVTADGSLDCSENPGEQENEVSLLLLWETITGLTLLGEGGSFVIKMFTAFERFTIGLLYFLRKMFQNVTFIKPGPSKPGNSEVYLVCEGFFKLICVNSPLYAKFRAAALSMDVSQADIFPTVPKSFLSGLINYSRSSSEKQIHHIKENLETFTDESNAPNRDEVNEIKTYIAKRFIKEYAIYSIENYISPLFVLKTQNGLYYNRTNALSFKKGSYNDRTHPGEKKRKSIDIETAPITDKAETAMETSTYEDLHEITFSPDNCCCFDSIKNFQFVLGKKAMDINSSRFIPSVLLKQYHELRTKFNDVIKKADETNSHGEEKISYHHEMNRISQSYPAIGIQKKHILCVSDIFDLTEIVEYFAERSVQVTQKTPGSTTGEEPDSESSRSMGISKFDMIICDLGSVEKTSKQKNLSVLKEVLRNMGSSQTLLIRLRGLVFSSFWHGIFYLFSSLFMNVTFVESNWLKDLYYFVYSDCNATTDLAEALHMYLTALEETLEQLDDEQDVFHTVEVYALMQSKYRQYMLTRNECLAQNIIDDLSKL